MVNSISGHSFQGGMHRPQASNQQSLTQDQRKIIEETLSQYDPQNLTQADAASIVETFNDSGIQPGRDLAGAMAEFGFDARAVGDLAGVGGPQQAGGEMMSNANPVTLNISEAMLQQLNELLNEYYSDDLADDDRDTALTAIKELLQESVPEGGLVNIYA